MAEAQQAGGARRQREGTVATAYDVGDASSVEGLKRVHQIAVMDTLGLENSIDHNRAIRSPSHLFSWPFCGGGKKETGNPTDGDLKEIGWNRELVVKPNAWKRLMADAEQVIRTAVEAGELEAGGAGKKLAVRRASFDALASAIPVTVYTNVGQRLGVLFPITAEVTSRLTGTPWRSPDGRSRSLRFLQRSCGRVTERATLRY